MNKYEFLYRLDKSLNNLAAAEREEITHYYDELIQDAVESGKNEEDFIDRLGSIETILRTIKKDSDFVKNVKEKKNFELRKVFSASSRLVGTAITIFIIFVLGSIAFSFVTSGLSLFVVAGLKFVTGLKSGISSMTLTLYVGNMLLGVGLTSLGVYGFWWLVKESKDKLEKLIEWIQKTIDKRGDSK